MSTFKTGIIVLLEKDKFSERKGIEGQCSQPRLSVKCKLFLRFDTQTKANPITRNTFTICQRSPSKRVWEWASMTPCLFAPGSHSDHNGFCFRKFLPGSESTCTPPAFRCKELSWPFFSNRLVLLLALRILVHIPRTEVCSTLRFFNLSFFAVSQVCWAHLFWLSCGEP